MSWYRRIRQAERSGGFSAGDRDLAADWTTCACGEQDERIPRFKDGKRPRDKKLSDTGIDFNAAVQTDDFARARVALWQIENRAAEILARWAQQ